MRLVIDTNVWISFLIGKSLQGLSERIISKKVTLLFSNDLFSELIEVLQRPKFKKYFSEAAIEELMSMLYDRVTWVEIEHTFTDCRDAKDNFLLDLAVSGQADLLITGEDDLLSLNPFHGIQIISYRDFTHYFPD